MRQLIQDFKSGQIKLVDVPPPALAPGCVRVRNAFSLVSAGTERATVNLAQQSLVGKARSRPDLVRRVVDTVKREGLSAAVRKVQSQLDRWKTLVTRARVPSSRSAKASPGCRSTTAWLARPGLREPCRNVVVPAELVREIVGERCVRARGVYHARRGRDAGGASGGAGIGEVVAVIGLGLVGQLTVEILRRPAAWCWGST